MKRAGITVLNASDCVTIYVTGIKPDFGSSQAFVFKFYSGYLYLDFLVTYSDSSSQLLDRVKHYLFYRTVSFDPQR